MTAVSLLERKEHPRSQADGKRLRDIFSMPAHNMETLEPWDQPSEAIEIAYAMPLKHF